jgi:ornithine cyclodeaminase/alanine dehydrogenase-like protein (mu-crystallin family)
MASGDANTDKPSAMAGETLLTALRTAAASSVSVCQSSVASSPRSISNQ